MAVTQQVISTTYEITSEGASDTDHLRIRVSIEKGSTALSGASEAQILGFVKTYLQSLSPYPIAVGREQVIRIDGL
jgi:hypothetical protein